MDQTQNPWVEVESKAFQAYRYFEKSSEMDIRFPTNSKGTPIYRYSNVTPDVYKQFMDAPSKGSFVIQTLVKGKDEFPFRRLAEEEAA